MLRTVLQKSWKQHRTKQQLYRYLYLHPQAKLDEQEMRGTWMSKDEIMSEVSYGRTRIDWPGGTYIYQLCADIGCSIEDLPGAMDERGGRWERGPENLAWFNDDNDQMNSMEVNLPGCPENNG